MLALVGIGHSAHDTGQPPALLHDRVRKVLAAQKRVLGDEHPDTLITADNLANTVMQKGGWLACVVC